MTILILLSLLAANPILAQEVDDGPVPRATAQMIRVPVPILGNVDNQVRRTIRQLKQNLPDNGEVRPILVLEFWPPLNPEEGSASEFERSLSLARFLSGKELSGIRTVAYLPRTVIGHAVLPVIACEQIIMHPDAELGDAGVNEDNLSMTVRGAYREISNRRRTVPEAVALGMLDRALSVYKAQTNDGDRYVLQDEADELKAENAVDALDTVIGAGDIGKFTGRELRLDHGFVSHFAADRRELAAALSVSVNDLEPNPGMTGDWKPIRIAIDGPMNSSLTNRVQRTIEERLRNEGTNFVLLDINSPGGAPAASLNLAAFLAGLDAAKLRTVAFVSNEARADAAIVAIACDHLVMHDAATLGGSGAYQPSEDELRDMRAPIQHLCREKSKAWSLPVAIMDPTLEVKRYALKETAIVDYFSDDELSEQVDPARWHAEAAVTDGQPLETDANQAEEYGLVRYVVDGFDEVKQLYQLENDPTLIEPNWADELVHQLAQPHVAGTLMFFAGFALIVELTSPGIGAGAFISTVCFSLFFWSQYLSGTATWLEVILFVLGIAFIAVEIFVLPGFGVFGLGGAALIVASLILASQTFVLPQNEYQMRQLPWSILSVVLVGAGVVSGLVVLRKYLHQAPILRRMMLDPPSVAAAELVELDPLTRLLNQTGETITPLMPSGRARIDDDLVDVVSDGAAIERGVLVRVTSVDGGRILVSPADA
jgi:membrane-bound ClpP family serine protease